MTGERTPADPDVLVPAPRPAPPEDPFDGFDDGSLMVFVPAIMGVGVLFSVATLVRDAFQRTSSRSRERRIALETASTVGDLLDRPPASPAEIGLLARGSYVSGAVLAAAAGVVVAAVGLAVYTGGDDADRMGWLLAAAALVAVGFASVAAACAAVARRWPEVPSWAMPMIRTLPLTHHPRRRLLRPRRLLTDAVIAGALGTGVLTLFAKAWRDRLSVIDDPVRDAIADMTWLDHLDEVDLFGLTAISVGFVIVIGLSGFRCRVMALVYPAAFVAAWGSTALLQELVERDRPIGFGQVESFPSGHMVQAVFVAGLVPTALAILFRLRPGVVLAMRAVLGAFVVVTALRRIYGENHWPTDVLAGLLLGFTVVAATHWVLEHRWWHQRCSSCRWSAHPEVEPWSHALYDLRPRTAAWLGRAGTATAVAASALLFVATATVGLPARQADDGLGPEISEPVQLGLAVLVAVAGFIGLRWRAHAAFLVALCATLLGLMASIEYSPWATFSLTLLLLVPAVLLWLGWQRHATVGAIFALAALTATSLTATALGSREIYRHYFGPTHPHSTAEALDSDAEWLWLGSVTTSEATVVAGGLPESASAQLWYWSAPDGEPFAVAAATDEDGVARFDLAELAPGTEYAYAVTAGESSPVPSSQDRSFHTFRDGPHDVVIAVGSCARSGSNGAVFDGIVRSEPDLFLSVGDMHYADLVSDDPDDHLAQYERVLTKPGPAALYGSIPTAYVWDDHDFGPNDADSTSPSREAVSAAYRQAVPHYGVGPSVDEPIAQALTIGRVRVIVTDTRSQRTADTMLGAEQIEWLIDEITEAAPTHAVVVWANPTPWIAAEGSDNWSNFPAERTRIADAIAAAGIDNLVMVSGDAHMVAIDDGTNSGYASDGSFGFPVLHAAALDRPGNAKGGPYSHGAIAGSGQYGEVTVEDDGGDVVTVHLRAWNWEGDELLSHRFEVPVDPV